MITPGYSLKLFLIAFLLTGVCLGFSVEMLAAEIGPDTLSAFRQVKEIQPGSIKVPTVVEVPFEPGEIERADFLLIEGDSTTPEPHLYEARIDRPVVAVTVSSSGRLDNLADGRFDTFDEFTVPVGGDSMTTEITVTSQDPITSTSLTLALDNYSALPRMISIRVEGGESKTVLARSSVTGTIIRFPQTTASKWIIRFEHVQPLRVAELSFIQEGRGERVETLRFLARPSESYRLYLNPDRSAFASTPEAGNLRDDVGVRVLPPIKSTLNPLYRVSDYDGDGRPDVTDNCVSHSNAEQTDADDNGRGDVCDDFDRDGILNVTDNCTDHPNSSQTDIDADGIGDACDGEESRVTERLPWLPWTGGAFVALVILLLAFISFRNAKTANTSGTIPPASPTDTGSTLKT